jgi:hypothetical protein
VSVDGSEGFRQSDDPTIDPSGGARELGCPLRKGERVHNLYVDGRKKLTISVIAERFRDKFTKGANEVAT